MIPVILFKMVKHSDFHLSFFQIVGAWQDFTVVTKLMKNFKSLYGFGGRCLKIRDVCMDFEPYFKVHNLVSVHPKSIIPISTWSFIWWCQFIDWLKFETRPSSLMNFGTAYTMLCTVRVPNLNFHHIFKTSFLSDLTCTVLHRAQHPPCAPVYFTRNFLYTYFLFLLLW